MPYKKINSFSKLSEIDKINAELEDIWQTNKDGIATYCENCGGLLVEKEGRIMKFDNGTWQRLFCNQCFDLQCERQLSHV